METYKNKCDSLYAVMDKYAESDVMIAFSGGVDSSLLLKIACDSANRKGNKVYAVTVHTMLNPFGELENAKKVAKEVGAIHFVIKIDEFEKVGILNNPIDRCYLCKKYLFEQIIEKANKFKINTIIDGTNKDDLKEYRPGVKAIKELGIKSPLAEIGITKEVVRKLALEKGVSVSMRPSTPCLATRFPYGITLSYEKMRTVEKGESFIKAFGIYNVRLRIHDELVRIEVDKNDISKVLSHKENIINYLKDLGYVYVTIDLEGFRSGSMDYSVNENIY